MVEVIVEVDAVSDEEVEERVEASVRELVDGEVAGVVIVGHDAVCRVSGDVDVLGVGGVGDQVEWKVGLDAPGFGHLLHLIEC